MKSNSYLRFTEPIFSFRFFPSVTDDNAALGTVTGEINLFLFTYCYVIVFSPELRAHERVQKIQLSHSQQHMKMI